MQDVCNKLIKEGLRPGQPKATNDQRDEISRQLEKLSDKQLILGSCVHGVDMDELEKVKVRWHRTDHTSCICISWFKHRI